MAEFYLFIIMLTPPPSLTKYNFISFAIFNNCNKIKVVSKLSKDFIEIFYYNQTPY